ncbi:hypothetical protein OG788_46690 [Streptomyces sp. NBC_00647]|uniref:hypothetical protein n=1 Tax=Streptomyces sp. NBC_00647 TaxID=2975796 RepID=UPI003244D6B6
MPGGTEWKLPRKDIKLCALTGRSTSSSAGNGLAEQVQQRLTGSQFGESEGHPVDLAAALVHAERALVDPGLGLLNRQMVRDGPPPALRRRVVGLLHHAPRRGGQMPTPAP